MTLNIIVLAKQVPDTRDVGPDAMTAEGTVNRSALPVLFNPDDLAALEQALCLKEQYPGSTITMLTMGLPRAAEILREGLYRGVDKAILLTDRALGGADTLATSYALSQAIRKIGIPDIVLCGRQAIDGDTAQVGPQVAEKLGLTQLTCVESLEVDSCNGKPVCLATRSIDGGTEEVKSPLPCLITVCGTAAPCRPCNARLLMTHKRAVPQAEGPLQQWGVADIKADTAQCGLAGSPTKVKEVRNIAFKAKEKCLLSASDDDLAKVARLLTEHLQAAPSTSSECDCDKLGKVEAKGTGSQDIAPVLVYCEMAHGRVADVSQELLTKGRELADRLGADLEAVAIGTDIKDKVEEQILPYGVDTLYIYSGAGLTPYTTQPHARIMSRLIGERHPQIALLGATTIGRDLGPRVSSACTSGLTADCTELEIGDYTDKRTDKVYHDLLYQIRPAFGGNIVATIVNPDHRPQMATVRSGVMKAELCATPYKGKVVYPNVADYVSPSDFNVEVLSQQVAACPNELKHASIVVAGGYGVGSAANFDLLRQLAHELHGEVGASRAAIDAGFCPETDRQIGQTGVTVRPQIYIACGISGAIQHVAGMKDSRLVISINRDADAPINQIADYAIAGTVEEVVPKLLRLLQTPC